MMAREVMSRFRGWRDGNPKGPLALYIFPTRRCNLTCVFCRYRHWDAFAHQEELSDSEWLRILRESAEDGVQWLDIMGGEPLLRKGLILKLSELARQHGVKGSLVTNGMLLTRDVARALVQNEWELIQVSVDAPVEDIHNTFRMHDQSFMSALRGMDAIHAERRAQDNESTKIQVNMVLTSRTVGMLPQMVQLAQSHNCDKMKFIPMVFTEHESGCLRIPDNLNKELLDGIHSCQGIAAECGIETNLGELQDSLEKSGLDSQAILRDRLPRKQGYPLCYAPWWNLTVFPDGGATCCLSSDDELANLTSRSVEDIWACDAFEQVRHQIISSPISACKKCCYVKASENLAIQELES